MKSNKKAISFLVSMSLVSFAFACNNTTVVGLTSPDIKTNTNKKEQYIVDLTPNSTKSGATVRVSLSGILNKNSFSTKTLPSARKKISDAVYFKVRLTTNIDNPINNLVGGPSSYFFVNGSDTTVTFLNVPTGGPYYAFISMYDASYNNITEPNRKLVLGGDSANLIGISGYVSDNKVIVDSSYGLTFRKANNTTDTINYLTVDLMPKAAVPGDEAFEIAADSTGGSNSISLNENGDGLIVYSKKVGTTFKISALEVDNYIPIGSDLMNIESYITSDPKPKISLDKYGTGYIVWRSHKTGIDNIYAAKVNSFVPVADAQTFSVSNNANNKVNPFVRVNIDDGSKAMVVWTDYSITTNGSIFERIINANGTLTPTLNPLTVNTDLPIINTHDDAYISNLDSSGKGLIVWTDGRNSLLNGKDIYIKEIQNFSTQGTETKANHYECSGAGCNNDQGHAAIEIDNNGNGILSWLDNENILSNSVNIYMNTINNYTQNAFDNSLDSGVIIDSKISINLTNPALGDANIIYGKTFGDIYSANVKAYSYTGSSTFQSGSGPVNSSISLNKNGHGLLTYNNDSLYGRHILSTAPVENSNELIPFGAIASYSFDYLLGDNSYYSTITPGIKDISGNGRDGYGGHGTAVPSISPDVDRFGTYSRTLSFHSSSENHVSIDNSDRYFSLKKQFSFSAWADLNNVDTDWSTVSGTGTSNSSILSNFEDGGFALQMANSDIGLDKIGLIAKINGNIEIVNCPLSDLLSGIHHFSGTFDGKNLSFYVDGELKSTKPLLGIFQVSYTYLSNSFIIGADAGPSTAPNSGTFFDGKIDDVRIYDFALNENEVKALYKQSGYNPAGEN